MGTRGHNKGWVGVKQGVEWGQGGLIKGGGGEARSGVGTRGHKQGVEMEE